MSEKSSIVNKLKKLFKNIDQDEIKSKLNELQQKLYEIDHEPDVFSLHPYLKLFNDYLFKLQTFTNTILFEYRHRLFFCQSNIAIIIKSMIVNDFIKMSFKRILPEVHDQLCCFNPETLSKINSKCMYYSDSYMKMFNMFYSNIIKYFYLKISLCLEDQDASIPEKFEFIFKTLIECYETVLYQLNMIDISCEDIINHKNEEEPKCKKTVSAHTPCFQIVKKYILLLVTDIVHKYDIITDDVIDALKMVNPDTVLLILDYNLLSRDIDGTLNIDEHFNLKKIIEETRNHFKGIYIINHEGINFGQYEPYFQDKKLKDQEELKSLIDLWKESKFTKIPTYEEIIERTKARLKEKENIKKQIEVLEKLL